MALILHGNSELCAHIWSALRYLICLRHLFLIETSHKSLFCFRKDLFSFIYVKTVLSYHLTLSAMGGFQTHISKCSEFVDFLVHRGICNKMFWKVKNFEFKKPRWEGGGCRTLDSLKGKRDGVLHCRTSPFFLSTGIFISKLIFFYP